MKLLLCGIGVIAILAGVGIAPDTHNTQRSREAVLKENLFRMRDAIDQYYADKNHSPSSLDDLVTAKYLREIPKDPITESADTWRMVIAEPHRNNPGAKPGIADVKSGADGTALNGSRFSDW